MEYRLLTAASPADLDRAVNALLQQGWLLYDGPLACAAPPAAAEAAAWLFAQAMTRVPATTAAQVEAEVGELLERVGGTEATPG